MFCKIDRHSSNTGFWKAIPTVERGFVTFSPKSQTAPESGASKPAIKRVKVDFPQPDGPTTAPKLFFGIFKDSLSKTGNDPVCVLYICETLLTSIESFGIGGTFSH